MQHRCEIERQIVLAILRFEKQAGRERVLWRRVTDEVSLPVCGRVRFLVWRELGLEQGNWRLGDG
jgi:hypothetical protein